MVIIVATVLAAHVLLLYSFGVFLRPLTMEFNWERGALSTALSICMLTTGLLSLFTGRLSDKYGPRFLVTASAVLTLIGLLLLSKVSSLWQVYLIFELLMAPAGACCIIPITSTIPRWFAKKRGIALGLAFTGFGLGGIIAPILAQWLIDDYGWRQAYAALGFIIFIIIAPLAQFMKHSPQRVGLKPYGETGTVEGKQSLSSVAEGLSFKEAIKTGRFWNVGLLLFGFALTTQVIVTHIVPHAVDIGISATIAASILSISSAAGLVGRNIMGFLSDKIGARLVLGTCALLMTLAMVWVLFSRDVWMFYVFALIFGFAQGGIMPLQNLISAELFGLKFLGVILAGLMFCSTMGGAIGTSLAGYIFDVRGSYSLAFLICIIICALGVLLSLILLRSKGKRGIAVPK